MQMDICTTENIPKTQQLQHGPVSKSRVEIQSLDHSLSLSEANRVNELNASSSSTTSTSSSSRHPHDVVRLNEIRILFIHRTNDWLTVVSFFFFSLQLPLFFFHCVYVHVESWRTKLSMIMTMMACAWSDNSSPSASSSYIFLCVLFLYLYFAVCMQVRSQNRQNSKHVACNLKGNEMLAIAIVRQAKANAAKHALLWRAVFFAHTHIFRR